MTIHSRTAYEIVRSVAITQPVKVLDDGRMGYGITHRDLTKILWEEKISNIKTVQKWVNEWIFYGALERGSCEPLKGTVYLFKELENPHQERLKEVAQRDSIPLIKVVC